jgi:uncharacterized protein YdcH (DUF465 family)
MYKNRILHLTESHRLLDNQINEIEKTGNFKDEILSEMKKKKLALKDEISRLTKLQWEHDHESVDFDDDR